MPFLVKRVYEPPSRADGIRVLVDRLWPRGISRESARIDEWHKEIAPETELRKWFHADPARWQEFRRRYLAALRREPARTERLAELGRASTVTLLYASRDEAHNHAQLICEFLAGKPESAQG